MICAGNFPPCAPSAPAPPPLTFDDGKKRTLIMQIAKNSQLHFDSPYWTSGTLLNAENTAEVSGVDVLLPAYNDEKLNGIRICTTQTDDVAIDHCYEYHLDQIYLSAKDLFSGNGYVEARGACPMGQEAFEDLFEPPGSDGVSRAGTSSSYHSQRTNHLNCIQRPGFNTQCNDGNRARFGFCGNLPSQGCQPQDNADADFAIGIGCRGQNDPTTWGAGFNNYYAYDRVDRIGKQQFQAWVYAVAEPDATCGFSTSYPTDENAPGFLGHTFASADATGDPHLSLPHGGRADFRGEHKTLYNFLSAKDVSVNVMTELADFELHGSDDPRHKHVHGSFLTQAHVVARTSTGKTVHVSYFASVIGPTNRGFVNGTVDDLTFKLGAHKFKNVDDVRVRLDYSSLSVLTPQFEIIVTPINLARDVREGNVIGRMSGETNVTGGVHHRLDIQIKLLVDEATMAVHPHGIIGQAWDGDGLAVDGETDKFPAFRPSPDAAAEFTTTAMAKGAIEGVPSDYKMPSAYMTAFKYSRFGVTKAPPRDVASLVAAGTLNKPRAKITAAETKEAVGATEYNETHIEAIQNGHAPRVEL